MTVKELKKLLATYDDSTKICAVLWDDEIEQNVKTTISTLVPAHEYVLENHSTDEIEDLLDRGDQQAALDEAKNRAKLYKLDELVLIIDEWYYDEDNYFE